MILATSAEAFTVVKLVGAYLAYLGVEALRNSFRPAAEAPADRRGTNLYLQSVLNNVLNPKVAVFYLTFLPQFMSPGDNVPARSRIIWLTAHAYVLSRITAVLGRGGVRRWLERATGGVLIALGVRLALERR